jgi:cell division protein FtsW (lipid II flippase)
LESLIVELSKYVTVLLMAVYTYRNFRYFGADREKKAIILRRQRESIMMLHLLSFAVLFLNTGDEKLLSLWGAQAVFLWCAPALYGRCYPGRSGLLFDNMCLFLCVGFVILARLSPEKAAKQFAIVVCSAGAAWLIPSIIRRAWQLSRIPWVYGGAGLGLLTMVYVLGDKSYGAQLSLRVGQVSVQPSEFVKITFVFFIASMFYRSTGRRQIGLTSLGAALHVLILTISKDLGSALILFVTYVFMVFAATSEWKYLLVGVFGGWAASAAALKLFNHVRVRVMAWRNPWADIDNRGYQITQSLFAIGTGSWFGLGLCQGMPGKIPVVEKDFVLAAIAEEMGVLSVMCLLLVCLGCFVQFTAIACRMDALFYKLIALGLGCEYIVQVFLTAGGVTKFIPSTGVTLPLISYGGSSVLSTFIMFSIIQGLYILKGDDEEEEGYETEF